MVLRVETPLMYWVRMKDMKLSMMYQKLVLARHFASPSQGSSCRFLKGESW